MLVPREGVKHGIRADAGMEMERKKRRESQ